MQREKEWGLLHTLCVRPGALLSWEDPLSPALGQTFPSFLEHDHHQHLLSLSRAQNTNSACNSHPLGESRASGAEILLIPLERQSKKEI